MYTGKEIGLKIKDLCKEKDGNVVTMERQLGFSNGYVRGLIAKDTVPSAKRLEMIANYLGVSQDVLLGNKLSGPTSDSDAVTIPVLGRVAAGVPISAVENVIGQEEISQKMASTGEYFALKIRGDSMSPYIMDGDIVVVRQQDCAENGEIVVVLVDGKDGVCKRIKRTKDAVILISINPSYEPMVFTHAEMDSTPVKILGKVVEIRRTIK